MGQVDVKVNDELVKPIIEAEIQAAIAASLSKHGDQLLEKVIAQVLKEPVDNEGKPSHYSSTKTRLEWLSTNMLEKAVKDALTLWATENTTKIKQSLFEHLKRKANTDILVDSMIRGLLESTKNSWTFAATCKVERQ